MSFRVAWAIAGGGLLVLAFLIGWRLRRNILAILIDNRGRYSLTHFQLVLWTIVILSSALGVLISSGFDPAALVLPPELLGLMGISAGSAALAAGVKAMKDDRASGAKVARQGAAVSCDGVTKKVAPHFAQIWLEEEGDLAECVVSITKYQNFLFTLVIVAIYVAGALKVGGIPVLPEKVVWLIGISHAGYVGGKIPNKG